MRNEIGKTQRALAVAAITLLGAFMPVAGQTRQQPQFKLPPSPSAEPNTTPAIIVAPDEDYRIGPRDVIEVRIEDANELSGTFQINADGTFLMPYLKRIKAQDKTPEELSGFIADGLRGRYLKDPQVLVSVKQYYSRTFFIQGAVRKPGVYQMEGHPSLLKLINVAGGLAENSGSTAFIIREVKNNKKADLPADAGGTTKQAAPLVANQTSQAAKPSEEEVPEYTLKTVNISGLFKGRFDQNAYVEPGDIVNIPQADVFFVAGEVNAPGKFPLSDGTTLRQAIALAQNPTFNASLGNAVIFRQDPATGKSVEIPVDIGAVMKAKKEDIAIVANDIVIVPNSRAKTVGNSILKAFGMGAAQRGIYRY
ncbi:MAG: polysaccharide biosynthesis/export family protein [Acidobacteriota bacterium]